MVDFGCGDGSWIDSVRHRYKRAVGIDIRGDEPGAVAFGWEFVHGDLNRAIALPDSSADAILANQVIEHVANPLHLFLEAYRLLRPEGVFVVTTPNVRYVRHLLRLAIEGRGPLTSGAGLRTRAIWDDGHIHFFTTRDLEWLAHASGFSTVRTEALISTDRDPMRLRRLLDRMRTRGIVKGLLGGNVMSVAWK